jgi:hypothetical protein
LATIGNLKRAVFDSTGASLYMLEDRVLHRYRSRSHTRVALPSAFHDVAVAADGTVYIAGGDLSGDLRTVSDTVVTRVDHGLVAHAFQALRPQDDGTILLLSSPLESPYWIRLWRYDPATGSLTDLSTHKLSTYGCRDFVALPGGVLIVCGVGGGAYHYWTEARGWVDPAGPSLGNLSRVERSGNHAFVVDWSGRRIHRFEAGVMNDIGEAFTVHPGEAPWGIDVGRDGKALVSGGTYGSPLRATLIEVGASATSVPVLDFGEAPYYGNAWTVLNDVAFRPDCDGGALVGGGLGIGIAITFQRSGGIDCHW